MVGATSIQQGSESPELKIAKKAINSDLKKLRCAPFFWSGYGRRYVF